VRLNALFDQFTDEDDMLTNRFTYQAAAAVLSLATVACQNESTAPADTGGLTLRKASSGGAATLLATMNEHLEAEGMAVRVAMAEWITDAESGAVGQTVYANDRGNKQLGHDWVPGDPNRGGRTNITYLVDEVDGATGSGLSDTDTEAAIDRAMNTWEGVRCSTIPLAKVEDFGIDWGYVQWLFGFGGLPGWLADVTHGGWLPGPFFDLLLPGGSNFILGVTFTFIWIDPATGNPADMDNNGKTDVAFREIYYNDAFFWAINDTYDVETVALHEAGHGLSQAHFGKIFRTLRNGKLHFAPRALMNASYSGIQQTVMHTDLGGHCSNWAEWPNN
jgi:hypothetical protein